MNWIDREGTFRAYPSDWGVKDAKDTASVAVSIKFRIVSMWDGQEWHDWTQYGEYFTQGDFWFIKRDGTVNERNVRDLHAAIGWDGDPGSIEDADFSQHGVQVVVQPDTYKGKTLMKAAFINGWNADPSGGVRTVDKAAIASLRTKYGSQLRAIVGAKAPAKPTGKPAMPVPMSQPKPAAATVGAGVGTAPPSLENQPGEDSEIPF